MRHNSRLWRPTLLRIVALGVVIAAAPLPALAGETAPSTHAPPPSISASVQKIAKTEPLNANPRAAATTQGGADLTSKSFFKTPAGIIALVAAGTALGFTLYSTSNDRVSSPKVPFNGGGLQ